MKALCWNGINQLTTLSVKTREILAQRTSYCSTLADKGGRRAVLTCTQSL